MVADRIFRHTPTDRLEFEMTAKKWHYLIMMTVGIQNVISSAAMGSDTAPFFANFFLAHKKADWVKAQHKLGTIKV